MKYYLCQGCGFIHFDSAPEKCPVCGATAENFTNNDDIFKEAAENSPEAAVKHIPAVKVIKECGLIPEQSCTDVLIRIGETLHPMEEKHFIQFIDIYLNNKYAQRIIFSSNGVNPATCLHLKNSSGNLTVIENCNLHGYWKTEVSI